MKPIPLKRFSLLLITSFSLGLQNEEIKTNDISEYNKLYNINTLFDIILNKYTEHLVKTGKTEIQVPDFEERFSQDILSLKIEGAVIVSDGWFSNISTIHRTADADIEKVYSTYVLTAHVGFRELKIDYNYYDISLLGVHQNGNIHVDVGDNSVLIKLRAHIYPCNITLTSMKIEKLNSINVDISNLGIFENLTDDLTSWVVNHVTKWFRSYVESKVFPEVADVIKKADLCHYLLPLDI